MAWHTTNGMCGIRPPLQGLGLMRDTVPRAMPWAGMVRPFGANEVLVSEV